MSEKLCLQWNDFQDNVKSAFQSLRDEQDFSDVTLACEDGEQVEAHKVILAASSPFFQNLLKRTKHPHPLIFMKGVQSQDLVAVIDFIYLGEANVYQENLDSFLAIAEELKLKGLTGQNSSNILKEDLANTEPVYKVKEAEKKSKSMPKQFLSSNVPHIKASTAIAIPDQFNGDLEFLDVKVKSLMERGSNTISERGKGKNGTRQRAAFICKLCGKEDHPTNIKAHIERNHLEGIAIPCSFCDEVCTSRNAMSQHKSAMHKDII